MSASHASLTRRAFIAVLLTVGFYGLALAVAALLLFIVYAQVRFAHRIDGRLTLACIVTAGVILWSILPRIDRFTPPGPRLEPKENPGLFHEVNDIADKVEQKPPDDVYLIPVVNAFVAERGGLLGIGRRRIMGVGLPLFQTLTVPQFRSVIAHEFGHFYGGDTKLAPWVYRTRESIVRTIQSLGEKSWLQFLFRWYGMMFLRVTNAISRNQEFVADRVAAQMVGSRPFIEGLRIIHAVAPAFQAFIQTEFGPTVEAGFRPPLVEGFRLFLGQASVADAMRRSVAEEVEAAQTNPYDTHPSLRERIAAAEALPPGPDAADEPLALSLVPNMPDLEDKLLVHWVGAERAAGLSPMDWQSAATTVWLPAWDKTVRRYAAGLKGVTAASLPRLLQSPGELGTQIDRSAGRLLPADEKTAGLVWIAGTALAVALARQGWTLDTSPGAPVSLERDGYRIEPFAAVAKLGSGEPVADAWPAVCQQAGIADLALDGEA